MVLVRAGELSHKAEPFCKLLVRKAAFGTLVAVRLPEGMEPVPARHLEALPEAERRVAAGLRGRRQIEWVGGRLALRLAAEARGLTLAPVLSGPKGEPLLPEGITASISHKRGLAAALLERGGPTLGLDIEALAPPRPAIATRILDEEEQRAWGRLPRDRRWPFVLRRFALKEATYKAIYPHLRRYVSFEEAHIARAEPGGVSLRIRTRQGEPELGLEAELFEEADHLWAMVRAQPRSGHGEGEEER